MKDISDMNIAEIAQVIRRDWKQVYFGAVPYLDAMRSMDSTPANPLFSTF